MNVNIEKLRKDLIDYFGTVMGAFPMALMELSEVQSASPEKLIRIAEKNGFDLSDYAE